MDTLGLFLAGAMAVDCTYEEGTVLIDELAM